MSKLKVYISSTYNDLKAHRKQVIDFFEKKTIKESFELTSMERYVASNNRPLLECLEDVKNSDVYILIIGNRYGYIPEDAILNPKKLSITELEYQAAEADGQKTILAFFADETSAQFESDREDDENLLKEKKDKLRAFKIDVRTKKMVHPEPFISPYHLALQIAESLMRKSFIEFKMEDTRKYCCDRTLQFSRYLQIRNKSRFKTILVYGDRTELGLNLINRFSIFTLNLTEMDVVPPLTFEEFHSSNDYEQSKTDLLVAVYNKVFNYFDLPDTSTQTFLKAFAETKKPLVFVINCELELFQEAQIDFLRQLLEELYKSCLENDSYNIYLFLNFEGKFQPGVTPDKFVEFQNKFPNYNQYMYILPALQSLNMPLVRNWLMTYITPDQGKVEELIDSFFIGLPDSSPMRVVEKKLSEFIKQINNKEAALFKILN